MHYMRKEVNNAKMYLIFFSDHVTNYKNMIYIKPSLYSRIPHFLCKFFLTLFKTFCLAFKFNKNQYE